MTKMEAILQSRICELEDYIAELETKVDLLEADVSERDAHIRNLKGQLIRKREDHLYPVSIAG